MIKFSGPSWLMVPRVAVATSMLLGVSIAWSAAEAQEQEAKRSDYVLATGNARRNVSSGRGSDIDLGEA